MTFLLDVNVVLALLDPDHIMHETAHDWFDARGAKSWATCPIVQNGAVRIISQPSYQSRATAAEAASALRDFVSDPGHQFWADDISLIDSPLIDTDSLRSSSQTTDTYLLALAISRGAMLATFDRRLSTRAVVNGEQSLERLA